MGAYAPTPEFYKPEPSLQGNYINWHETVSDSSLKKKRFFVVEKSREITTPKNMLNMCVE